MNERNADKSRRIPAALEILQVEYRRTVAERDAFDAFAEAVSALNPAPTTDISTRTAPPAVGTKRSDGFGGFYGTDTGQLRQAYRESVMDFSHYEEEYDESLAVNMQAEFGSDLAAAVISDSTVTPRLQRAVVAAATEAREEREEFVTTLDAEQSALKTAQRTLSEIHEMLTPILNRRWYRESFDEAYTAYQRLEQEQSRCRDLLQDRQTQRQTGHAGLRSESVPDLQSYLYYELNSTYPVLSDTLQLYDDLCLAHRRIERWLARDD